MTNNTISKKFTNHMFIKEFSIPNNPYFTEENYVCVSSVDDEEYMEKLIEKFFIHNQGIYCCKDAIIMPKETYKAVFKPTIDDIVEFNKQVDREKTWNCSDDDQWIKYLGNHVYEFYTIVEDDDGDYRVYHDTVDIKDFISFDFKNDDDYEHAVMAIRSYGHGIMVDDDLDYKDQLIALLSELTEIYGDLYEQIIAEMLFETYFQQTCNACFTEYNDAFDYIIKRLN